MDDTCRSSGTLVTSLSGGVNVSITVLPERVKKGTDTQLPSSPQPGCFARLHKSAKPRNRGRRTKMLRLVGYWSQPLLGALNYVLSPVKPAYKPVVLPKGTPRNCVKLTSTLLFCVCSSHSRVPMWFFYCCETEWRACGQHQCRLPSILY